MTAFRPWPPGSGPWRARLRCADRWADPADLAPAPAPEVRDPRPAPPPATAPDSARKVAAALRRAAQDDRPGSPRSATPPPD